MKINYKLCNEVKNCKANGVCNRICASNAIKIEDNKPVLNNELCYNCGLCRMNCPRNAID